LLKRKKIKEQEICFTLYTIPERPLPSSILGLNFFVASMICLRVKVLSPIFTVVSICSNNTWVKWIKPQLFKNYSDREHIMFIDFVHFVFTSQFSVSYPAHSPHEGQQQQQKQNTAYCNQRNFPTMQFSGNLGNI
jgi:hypothetical protein